MFKSRWPLLFPLMALLACGAEPKRTEPTTEAIREDPKPVAVTPVEAPEPEPVCPGATGQDRDADGLDDACDDDLDGDGVANKDDNCPAEPNPDQVDINDNKVGDRCDRSIDKDLDQIVDRRDNCPKVYNPDQSNLDRDKSGDACDRDLDGDRVPNDRDNCALIRNKEQKDRNGNGIGDRCEGQPCLGNDCGGCSELPVVIGDDCGVCGEGGKWQCRTRESVRCVCD